MNTAITTESKELLERVSDALKTNHLPITKIAEAAGMTYLQTYRQLKGLYNIDIRLLIAIARLCPNISAEWLLRGKGDIYVDENSIEERLARVEKLLQSGK